MARPRTTILRPSRPHPDPDIRRRKLSGALRSQRIRQQMKSDPEAPEVAISDEEIGRILEVVPRHGSVDSSGFALIDREEVRARIASCLRG
jgi:hypothetical protein